VSKIISGHEWKPTRDLKSNITLNEQRLCCWIWIFWSIHKNLNEAAILLTRCKTKKKPANCNSQITTKSTLMVYDVIGGSEAIWGGPLRFHALCTGARPDYHTFWRGHSLKQKNRKSKKSWGGRVVSAEGMATNRHRHISPSWPGNQYQTLTDCLSYHMFCIQLGPPWAMIAQASRAVFVLPAKLLEYILWSNKSNINHHHWICELLCFI